MLAAIAMKLGLRLLIIITISLSILLPHIVMAQPSVMEGLEVMNEEMGFEDQNLMEVLAGLIKSLFSILGILLLLVILYGGFLYMISGGADEKVDTAKKTILNGVIGIVIILLSFSLVNFVFAQFGN
jgi:hypothetical protein